MIRGMAHDYRAEAEAHARRAREAMVRYPSDVEIQEAIALALALSELCLAFAAEDDRVRSASEAREAEKLTRPVKDRRIGRLRGVERSSSAAPRKGGA